MKKYLFSEELGNIDEKYIEEVLEYRKGRKRMNYIGFGAMAACMAVLIGVGAVGAANSGKKPESAPTDGITSDIVEVEKSYNDRIENGEDVDIETYIGIPYHLKSDAVGDFTYTLRDVRISDRLPEGITASDLDNYIGPVSEYDGSDNVKRFESEDGDALDISECIDSEGLFNGPGNGYKWVFLTIDIANNSNTETIEFINSMTLVGGEYKSVRELVDGEWKDTGDKAYEYRQELCYHNAKYFDYDVSYEMTFSGLSDEEKISLEEKAIKKFGSVENYLREKFSGVAYFDAGETKSVTVGFPVNNYFVYGELLLELNPEGAKSSDLISYIPLK